MVETAGDRTFAADDAAARERALDVTRSFLVQAPAGAGKTELLIQRYLALLACVERPEQIVAITFTRKAAGEMRERIVAALAHADTDAPADSPHDMATRALARAALARDERQGWRVLEHPSRLAVTTIDALVAALARQAPVTTELGAAPRYEEHAEALYAEAVRRALDEAPADDPGWRRLLAHQDNDAEGVVRLLADMLAKRDQWIEIIVAAKREGFRAALEDVLAAEIVGEMEEAAALVPASLRGQLVDCERDAATALAGSPQTLERANALASMAATGGLPPAAVDAQAHWRELAEWLLVAREARFRRAVTTLDGFPAKGKGPGAAAREQSKVAMLELLERFGVVPELASALDTVRRLPQPRYPDDAWAMVEALLDVLPRAAECLLDGFRDTATIDFTQGTIGALAALGGEAPTDLLLKVDLQIRHLLIDEFQDTSFTQIELLRRLTAGWEPDDGRTLFAVGDPMQSIYRFRGAEVRLFVEAQDEQRVAGLPIETLVLHRNFRSQRGLVEWVNDVFADVLGPRSDPWRGKVGFTPAIAKNDRLPGAATTIDVATDAESEALTVLARVRAALDDGVERIGILVRARSHLEPLLTVLRDGGVAFAAIDLDALADKQSVLDLVSLTHALLQPADRLAWLAVLRAPWCGMTLRDLFAVADASAGTPAGSIASLVLNRAPIPGCSEDGAARFARLAGVLAPALAARGRADVAVRVRGAWLALGGPVTVREPVDLDAAERYFALLAEHESGGDVPEWSAFTDALSRRFVAPEGADATRVHVMTLHRAKGLQFDAVILPGLARMPPRDEPEILRWRRRPQGLLLASTEGRGSDGDPLYEYLGALHADEQSAELARLLYVGCTRAKRRLHLTAVLDPRVKEGVPGWAPPPSGSALAKCWGAIESRIGPPKAVTSMLEARPGAGILSRFAASWKPATPEPGVPATAPPYAHAEPIPFDWARETARHVGTVAHRLFAQIARDGLPAWSEQRAATLTARIRVELSSAGVDDAELDAAAASVLQSACALLTEDRGRWLLDAGHAEARSEWALAGIDDGAVAHIVIDRSFVADGVRWIVDFKTGAHEGAEVDAFIEREVARYRGQLERYARFVRALDPRPIRLGLYFALQRAWREWPYEG
ncbi:MAG TPA: UvrD-helicase domain-containing protein [Casimicrobiaceae bacterium]|nr:UvrD-helicase domain-containing protein [Casimicrobiaceae bacterium]